MKTALFVLAVRAKSDLPKSTEISAFGGVRIILVWHNKNMKKDNYYLKVNYYNPTTGKYDYPVKLKNGVYSEEWENRLSAKDRLQFQWEKENRNVLGLDPKQFKFIDYEDPRAKTGVKRCDVCGNIVAVDQFGDGECKNCGWEQDKFVVDHPDVVMYPHLISLNKAKKLYSQGKAFLPDFNDFIEALYMYSEMLFKHDGTLYEVFIRGDDTIVFCSDEMEQEFTSKNDFINESHIGSRLLKDIWNEVTDVSYMY